MRRPLYAMRCPVSAITLGLAITVSLGACGSASMSAGDPFTTPPSAPVAEKGLGSSNEIVQAEILRREGTDPVAYQLIQRLRPNWLLSRGRTSFNDPNSAYPVVYVDAIRYGGLQTLHQISSNQIRRIEFIGAADATIRWGTGHSAGVIRIVTGR